MTAIAALMLKRGDADAMLCGLAGSYNVNLGFVREVIGLEKHARCFGALNVLILSDNTLFVSDTYVSESPDATQLAYLALAAAEEVQRFGLPPKVAFLSHSNGESSDAPSAHKMRNARKLFSALAPHVEAAGEIHDDAALSDTIRAMTNQPGDSLTGLANVLICPNLDAANILFNVLRMTGGQGRTVGPILLGAAGSAHILTSSSTVRQIVNMTAVAAARAQLPKERPASTIEASAKDC